MPLRDHWWCILVAKYGVFLFTEIGAFVFTDYNKPHTDKDGLIWIKNGSDKRKVISK